MWGIEGMTKGSGAIAFRFEDRSDQFRYLKPGTIFSGKVLVRFVVFKSRKHRDKVNAKVFADPLMNDPRYKDKVMPFDMKRMVHGGFKTLVEA